MRSGYTTPFDFAFTVAEIIKTLRVTSDRTTKITPFETHMRQKPRTPLSNIATTKSPKKLNWENADHPCLARNNLMYPPLTTEVLHDLQCWSESEVKVKRKLLPNLPDPRNAEIQREKGMSSSEGSLNRKFKGMQAQLDPNTGRFELVA